ncbi:hypothetical protein [Streptomyces sp. SID3212]|uniref:hypothetical protein n=1 Tax=unclassified Streptomyces TaxID=2593676 RepID=UPI00136D67A4|nr:hypothetical protein [Streptomyces sp. SID3212]MYV51821.1 hypothetical protein [Streptomyces sp. SID3212]
MHADIHLMLHSEHSTELRGQADENRRAMAAARAASPGEPDPASHDLRARLGWTMVELGLRLASRPPAREIPLA